MKTTLALLILASAVAVSAQEPQFGVQGSLSLPGSDLANNAYLGLQLGGHGRWDFGGGHGLMARADVVFYSQNNGASVTGLGLGADYTYHVDRRPTGLYLLAGLTQMSYRTSVNNFSTNASGLGLDLGAGYDLDRHLGLQVRYTTQNVAGGTNSALNLGATYSF